MDNKYSMVIDYIKREIAEKKLKSGGKLPSIRDISKSMQCNKITVIRAFSQLEREHIVYSVPKSGYYLVSNTKTSKYFSDSGLIDFSSPVPSSGVLLNSEFEHCVSQAIKIYKDEIFYHHDLQGILSLRKIVKKSLQDLQVFTNEDNIFITTGSQQTLFILAKMPFPNGKNCVLAEQPTYPGMLKALELNNVTTLGIRRNADGLNLDELENIFKNGDIKFFYTIPRLHNPTGYSYSAGQKKEIINLAKQHNVYIVEDDYLAELDHNKKADPIFSYDISSKVIYVKSYSKILLPWLRIGIVVLPHPMTNLFRDFKMYSDISSSLLSQGALEIYIKNGMYKKHLKRIKQIYQGRMQAAKKSFDRYLSGLASGYMPDTGYYTCLELPETIRAKTVSDSLKQKKVIITSAEDSFLPAFKKENILRLGMRNVDEDKIEEGIRKISEELARLQKNFQIE